MTSRTATPPTPAEPALSAAELEYCLGIFWRAESALLRDTGARCVADGRWPGVLAAPARDESATAPASWLPVRSINESADNPR